MDFSSSDVHQFARDERFDSVGHRDKKYYPKTAYQRGKSKRFICHSGRMLFTIKWFYH